VLRERFPQLRLFLREDVTDRLVARLESGRLDLLLVALPCECGMADAVAVMRDEFLVALPAGHPLAELERVGQAALEGERLLLLEDGHCLRDQALAACGRMRQNERDGFAATSLHTLVQMVAGNLGVTLIPRLAVEAGIIEGTGIELRPMDGAGGWRTIGLAWRPNAPRATDYRALGQVLSNLDL
jgi:LysR family hydrogen peroxide-inducible transcriptional activator